VDTPGVGSVYRHNTEAAYDFVPEADAAIFLTSADPPISEGELRFLRDVRAEAARMFFILNKVDYLSPADRADAEAFTREVLGEALGREVRLFPVSARRALDARLAGDAAAFEASGMSAFERDFRRFLLRDKGEAVVASVASGGRKLARDERNSIEVEDRALSVSVEELTERAEEMERVFAEAASARGDIQALLEKETRDLLRMVEQDLAQLQHRETPALLEEVERLAAEVPDPRAAGEELDRQVKESLRRRIDLWRAEEERRVAEAFRRVTARFTGEVDGLVERTVRLCAELLEVKLVSAPAPLGLPAQSRFTYSLFEVPDPGICSARRPPPAPQGAGQEADPEGPARPDTGARREALRAAPLGLPPASRAVPPRAPARAGRAPGGHDREPPPRGGAGGRGASPGRARSRGRLPADGGFPGTGGGCGPGARGDPVRGGRGREVNAPDPFDGFARDLDHEAVPADTVSLLLPANELPDAELEARFLLYLGLFDMLAEALIEACESDEERAQRLAALLSGIQSVEPVLRFRLAERMRQAEGQELIARMRGRDIAVTRDWLVPKLHQLIAASRARIDALSQALAEPDR